MSPGGMTHFPDERPDEPLISILARYHQSTGYTSYAQTYRQTFGSGPTKLIGDELPTRLDSLLARLPHSDITYEQLLQNNTSFPYYSRFLSQDRHSWLFDILRGPADRLLRIRVGMRGVGIKDYFCACLRCIEEDCIKYGDPYWRRVHQLPGVLVCPYHSDHILQVTTVVRQPNSFTLIPLSEVPRFSLTPLTSEKPHIMRFLRQIARDSLWLLNAPSVVGGAEYLRTNYFEYLREKGLVAGESRLKRTRFLQLLETGLPRDLLPLLEVKGKAGSFGYSIFRGAVNVSPLKHIIVLIALGTSCEQVFKAQRSIEPSLKRQPKRQFICLNPICSRYRCGVNENCVEVGKQGKDPNIPSFLVTCNECGFSYKAKEGDKLSTTPYLVRPGKLWEDHLKYLASTNISLKKAAEQLNVSTGAVVRHSTRLRIDKWSGDKNAPMRFKPPIEELKMSYLELRRKYPNKDASDLTSLNGKLVRRLRRIAPGWLKENAPIKQSGGARVNRHKQLIDWESIDVFLEHKIIEIGEDFIKKYSQEPPSKRVGMTQITRKLSRYHRNLVLRMQILVPKAHQALRRFSDLGIIVKRRRVELYLEDAAGLGRPLTLKEVFDCLKLKLDYKENKKLYEELSKIYI